MGRPKLEEGPDLKGWDLRPLFIPRSTLENYRPIFILPSLSKVLEKAVYKKRSTELVTSILIDNIRKVVGKGTFAGALF